MYDSSDGEYSPSQRDGNWFELDFSWQNALVSE